MVLAELNLALSSTKIRTKLFSKIGSLFFILIGLIAMSYPRDLPEKASWSFAMREMGEVVLPFNNDKYKPWVSLGCLIFMFGVNFSPHVQTALSVAPMVWLGKVSFPLYLLHGTFVRSLFAWILFAGGKLGPSARDKGILKYPLPSNAWIAFSVICLLIPLLICSHLWVKYLEPVFDKITLWLEGIMLGSDDLKNHRDLGANSGYIARLRSTFLAIIAVVQHGGLPRVRSKISRTTNSDSEAAALLSGVEDDEMYSQTQLFPLDTISVSSSRYHDEEVVVVVVLEDDKKEKQSNEII